MNRKAAKNDRIRVPMRIFQGRSDREVKRDPTKVRRVSED